MKFMIYVTAWVSDPAVMLFYEVPKIRFAIWTDGIDTYNAMHRKDICTTYRSVHPGQNTPLSTVGELKMLDNIDTSSWRKQP